jgi:hypothetical protein
MDTDLTAPLPPAAEAAMERLERALAAPDVYSDDRLAHDKASFVRDGRVA